MKAKGKLKLFTENMLVYGFGGVISRVVPLIMVPIIAYLFPNTELFGLSDNANTVLSFGSALAVMGMYDAMYRLFFEKEDEKSKKEICSTTMTFTLVTSLIVALIILLFRDFITKIALERSEYSFIVYIIALTTLVSATNGIISAPTRMQNKRKVFLVTNTLTPILSYSISIPLILTKHYVVALPLAALISGFIMEMAFLVMNRKWFDFKLFRKDLLKPLLVIAVPLLPNFLIYWVFNSSDKLMITNILGLAENGIYSVGAKLGHCSQLIYTAFAGGWQFFAFSTMKEKDQVKSNSAIFEYLGAISFVATAFLCAISAIFYQIVFPPQYYSGFVIAPYLFLAPLLMMLFQVGGNQLLVIKKTWPNSAVLAFGAGLNVVLNLYLIPGLGIEGASIATLSGYIFALIILCIVLMKMKLMTLNARFYLIAAGVAVFFVMWRLLFVDNLIIGLIAAFIYMLIVVFLYRRELNMLIGMINNMKNKKEDPENENSEES